METRDEERYYGLMREGEANVHLDASRFIIVLYCDKTKYRYGKKNICHMKF